MNNGDRTMTDYNGETATDEAGMVTMARGWPRSTRAMRPGSCLDLPGFSREAFTP